MFFVAGLDLAASPKRCSGYALLDVVSRKILKVTCLYDDDEILSTIRDDKVELVAIDAPLIEEPSYRRVDRTARSLGYPVLPPTLGPMRSLTKRAWALSSKLANMNVIVIETHPRSALLSSGYPRVETLLEGTRLSINLNIKDLCKDEVDAIISAVVAYCYVTKLCIDGIKAEDGIIYIIKKIAS
ncbi:MAG: DUF429 domain-containing protein [Desulfurococcales archaeon]|nr:DUF429 domain-containing protein [Desulfurococcales archaeon]